MRAYCTVESVLRCSITVSNLSLNKLNKAFEFESLKAQNSLAAYQISHRLCIINKLCSHTDFA